MNHDSTFDIFNLPLVLQQEVLGSWLTIKDVAKMDSAICSREARSIFLDLLSKEDMVLINLDVNKENFVSWMAWMVARKASVTECR